MRYLRAPACPLWCCHANRLCVYLVTKCLVLSAEDLKQWRRLCSATLAGLIPA
jgi:hypothetical protein